MHRFAKQVAKLKANHFLINGKDLNPRHCPMPRAGICSHSNIKTTRRPGCIYPQRILGDYFDNLSPILQPLTISRNLSISRHLLNSEKQNIKDKNTNTESKSESVFPSKDSGEESRSKISASNKISLEDHNSAEGVQGKSISQKPGNDSADGGSEKSLTKNSESGDAEGGDEKSLTLFQRFKKVYKTHGIVFIVVEIVTSVGWFALFYGIARAGLDIIPMLEYFNVSETVIKHFRPGSNLGDIALALIMYKLVAPLRWMVTIVGTQQVVKYRRKMDRMPEVAEEDRLREMFKEGGENLVETAKVYREQFRQLIENRKRLPKKDRQSRLQDMRQRVTDILYKRRQRKLDRKQEMKEMEEKEAGKEDEEKELETLLEEIRKEEERERELMENDADTPKDVACKEIENVNKSKSNDKL